MKIETPEVFVESLSWMSIDSEPDLKQWVNHVRSRDAAIRAECAERALVYYCQEVCDDDDEKQNAACRRKGGCKWANKLKAAIMGGAMNDKELCKVLGIKQTELEQLRCYITDVEREGWYYGNKEQFVKRHKRLQGMGQR